MFGQTTVAHQCTSTAKSKYRLLCRLILVWWDFGGQEKWRYERSVFIDNFNCLKSTLFFCSPKQRQRCETIAICVGPAIIPDCINHLYDNISQQIADPKITLWLLTHVDFKIEDVVQCNTH